MKDHKLTKKCVDCGCLLAQNSPHHFRCHTCWLAYNKGFSQGRALIKLAKKIRAGKIKRKVYK